MTPMLLAGLLLANAPMTTYTDCPGAALVTDPAQSWQAAPSRLEDHQKLRDGQNVPMPRAAYRIAWWSVGGHLETTRFSVVATRRRDGIWHSSGVGESVIWMQGAKPNPLKPMERDLSRNDSEALDRALGDPCLAASPTSLPNPHPQEGAMFSVIEIADPNLQWRGSWQGLTTPQVDIIVKLIGGE